MAINQVFLHCQDEEMRTNIVSGWGLQTSKPQLLDILLQSQKRITGKLSAHEQIFKVEDVGAKTT